MRVNRSGWELSLLCVVAISMAPLAPALGDEITVKNDSIVDFGTAVIVGDFIAGEHAGVRLTSPCDGTIVAVQIIWLEGTAGHGQSLEQAIHIYDGSTFPTPGTELETLVGPVMTPGYINEFRYLDQAQTLPLIVPVTNGQQFFVTLEFANPTDVGNGGPSVIRDVDGCQSGKNVLYAIPGGWQNFCLYLGGDVAIRAVIECPGTTGACCHATGICEPDLEEADCQEFGDVWYEALTCGEITCTPRGACCLGGGCLTLVDPNDCAAISGVYAGHGTDCDDDVCEPGACCFADGSCSELFEFECVAQGGTFWGVGTVCDPNPCPQPTGACCFGEVCLADQTEEQCTGATGEWGGAGTDCSDNNGNTVADVCESCPNPGTTPPGVLDYCWTDIYPSSAGDCIVNLSDLGSLLPNYGGTATPYTFHQGDVYPVAGGDGIVNLSDLGQLLAQYGDDCN